MLYRYWWVQSRFCADINANNDLPSCSDNFHLDYLQTSCELLVSLWFHVFVHVNLNIQESHYVAVIKLSGECYCSCRRAHLENVFTSVKLLSQAPETSSCCHLNLLEKYYPNLLDELCKSEKQWYISERFVCMKLNEKCN